MSEPEGPGAPQASGRYSMSEPEGRGVIQRQRDEEGGPPG
jgi:hypothetical protein